MTPSLIRLAEPLFGRDGRPFLADEPLIEAANAALLLGVPLLLTGEPGCGKTDFAFAVARWHATRPHGGHARFDATTWRSDDPETGLLQCYVRSETRERDLLYRVDAVGRFTDGQLGKTAEAHEIGNYVDLMPLGVAIASAHRRIVLVDEIDKAPRDLPNDLLRPIEQGAFDIREIPADRSSAGWRRTQGEPGRAPELRPLVIITSNRERELPEAFLRRCAFHHIEFPKRPRLLDILRGWFDGTGADARSTPPLSETQAAALVDTFLTLRARTSPPLVKKPATAELLQWTRFVLRGVTAEARQGIFDRRFVGRGEGIPWRSMPGLALLVKHTEDLRELTPAQT